jgi:hypothetical protein
MEKVCISYGRLVQCMTFWYNIWPFGIVLVVIWYNFPVLICLDLEKSGNPPWLFS